MWLVMSCHICVLCSRCLLTLLRREQAAEVLSMEGQLSVLSWVDGRCAGAAVVRCEVPTAGLVCALSWSYGVGGR